MTYKRNYLSKKQWKLLRLQALGYKVSDAIRRIREEDGTKIDNGDASRWNNYDPLYIAERDGLDREAIRANGTQINLLDAKALIDRNNELAEYINEKQKWKRNNPDKIMPEELKNQRLEEFISILCVKMTEGSQRAEANKVKQEIDLSMTQKISITMENRDQILDAQKQLSLMSPELRKALEAEWNKV